MIIIMVEMILIILYNLSIMTIQGTTHVGHVQICYDSDPSFA